MDLRARGESGEARSRAQADAGPHPLGRIVLAHEEPLTLGPLRIEPATRRILHEDGREEFLEPRVMQVFVALLRADGAILSRDDLVECCWDGRIVGDDSINRVLSRLRRLSETIGGGAFRIETITKVGYRLVSDAGAAQPVSDELPPAPPAGFWSAAAWRVRRLPHQLVAAGALALLAIAALAAFFVLRPSPAEAGTASIAVLPFRTLAPGDDYFSEGVAEEILSQLAREPRFRVAGRTSTWMFKDQAVDLRDVGRRLDVAYILEGSVRRAGDRVTVNVSLVGTDDGMRVWTHGFEGRLDDIFAIQRNIGTEVADRMRVALAQPAPVTGPLTTAGDVYSLYLTARGMLRTRQPSNIRAAIQILRRAIQMDPEYAPAWASLAAAVTFRPLYWDGQGTPPDPRPEARRYLQRALALAPGLAEARATLAMMDNRNPGHLATLEQVVRAEPGNPEYWHWLGNARRLNMDFLGQFEASKQVARIDPFWIRAEGYSEMAAELGLREEALRFEQKIMRDHPEQWRRERARARIAAIQWDWSAAYAHTVRASRIMPPTDQPIASRDPWWILIRLGMYDEVNRLYPGQTPPFLFDILEGRPPPIELIDRLFPGRFDFWESDPAHAVFIPLLINNGRGGEVVRFYDRAFGSPEDMASNHPAGKEYFLFDAPQVAVALRDAGRAAEADRMLAIADRMISDAIRRGRVPIEIYEIAARIWAARGRTDLALNALERAVSRGWQYDYRAQPVRLAQEPAYRAIRDHPRLKRLDAVIHDNIERERRETRELALRI